jgi:phage gp29-like protein
VPELIRVRDPRRFAWRPDGTMVLLTHAAPIHGEPIPDRKIWAYQTASWHDDDPYGMGIAHWCYWPVQFARGVAKLWLLRLDKSASPTALGHFPGTATPAERTKLLRALEAIRSHSSIILPDGMSAELLEASRGSEDYLQAAAYFDAAISKIITGHSAAADATPGRLGGEDQASEVRGDLVTADADLLCASANLTWVRWVVDWSYPGAAYPRIWRRTEEDEDLTSRATRERSIYDMGYRPTLAQIRETYDGEWEDVRGDAPAPAAQPAADADAPPAAPADADADADLAAAELLDAQDQIDAAAAADPGWQAAMEALLAPVLAALRDGLTPEEILGRMDEWYPALNDDALVGLLERGVAAAEAIGRLEVQREMGAD